MKLLAISSIALLAAQQVLATPAVGCLQTHIVIANDSCTSVAAQFQITEAAFYSMNPGLHHSVQHDCDNLDNGKPFCVCMTAPCPVKEAAAPAAVNSTAPVAPSAAAPVASSPVISSPVVSSPVASAPKATASPITPSAAASPSASASTVASSQPIAADVSSATITTAFGAITIGLVMTATSMLL